MCACSLRPTVRVISLDVTGTLHRFSRPIGEIYHSAALQASLPNPPTAAELQRTFRDAFKDAALRFPCYGSRDRLIYRDGHTDRDTDRDREGESVKQTSVRVVSERDWWEYVVRESMCRTGREYPKHLQDAYFRRVYQAFGSASSFHVFSDTLEALASLRARGLCLGVLTNSPHRTVEDTLPLLGLHKEMDWFVSAVDVGYEKPDRRLFDHTFDLLRRKFPSLKREEIIHVGDNYDCDYVGARNAGFQALLLDRSNSQKASQERYGQEISKHTIGTLHDIIKFITP